MRICVVAGYYFPPAGYIESQIADGCARLGHDVTVITSGRRPFSVSKSLWERMGASEGLQNNNVRVIVRRPLVSFRAHFFALGLSRDVKAGKYDVVIVIGVGQCFGLPALFAREMNSSKGPFRIVVFGDNRAQLSSKKIVRLVRWLLFMISKAPLYRLACRHAERVFATTPDGQEWIADQFAEKTQSVELLTLAYDAGVFHRSDDARNECRRCLGIKDDCIVFIFSGKLTIKKNTTELLQAFEEGASRPSKFLVVGDDSEAESVRVREWVCRSSMRESVIFLGQRNQQEINRFFNAADVGIWHKQPAISIQQGMGTGLYCILPSNRFVGHLLRPATGRYFKSGSYADLVDAISNVSSRSAEVLHSGRSERVAINKQFSSLALVRSLLQF